MQSILLLGGLIVASAILERISVIGLLLSPFVWLFFFVSWLVLMWKAFNGDRYKVPYVGELAEKQLAKLK
jgi:uncharacterized membrane protein